MIQKEREWCIVVGIDKSKNVRINLTIDKKAYNKLKVLSQSEMRSTNSLMVYLINQALQNEEWQNKIKDLVLSGELEE